MALEPTILGHGALIKSDVPAASAALLFSYAAWRYWREPRAGRLAALLGALLVAVLTKFTLLALIPVALVLVVWRGPRLTGPVLVAATVYLGLAAAYQFRFAPIPKVEGPWFDNSDIPPVDWILKHAPWPARFAVRYTGGAAHSGGFHGYLLEQAVTGATPWYFPLAWAIKFPIPLQLLASAGLAAGGPARTPEIPGCGRFHPGQRGLPGSAGRGIAHAPRLSPPRSGAAVPDPRRRVRARPLGRPPRRPAAAVALLLWLAIGSARVYPQGISYGWIGGPENGWRHPATASSSAAGK